MPVKMNFYFFIFLVMVLMVAILIWWIKKAEFSLNVKDRGDNYNVVENKWSW